jgi:hypothetical protein
MEFTKASPFPSFVCVFRVCFPCVFRECLSSVTMHQLAPLMITLLLPCGA